VVRLTNRAFGFDFRRLPLTVELGRQRWFLASRETYFSEFGEISSIALVHSFASLANSQSLTGFRSG
jgi:hypothetical protein